MLDATLRHLHRSSLGARCVLRGSLLTALWVPERRAHDIDFLVDGAWTPATLTPVVREALGTLPGLEQLDVITIWAETDFPGVRATLTRAGETVQADFGWGEQLAVPPAEREVRGLAWRTVGPEVMFGWKVHSLVEHGPRGRWHAKTMVDLVLYLRHVAFDRALARRAVELAFASQRMPLSQLDGFFDDPTWGQSRGSRGKWKSYAKKAPWVTFSLAEAIAEVRAALLPMLRAP
ncbi:MAG: nucleotidyl transferase AbiEii/AbiGii toxin family protein [Myxococcota bacterium]